MDQGCSYDMSHMICPLRGMGNRFNRSKCLLELMKPKILSRDISECNFLRYEYNYMFQTWNFKLFPKQTHVKCHILYCYWNKSFERNAMDHSLWTIAFNEDLKELIRTLETNLECTDTDENADTKFIVVFVTSVLSLLKIARMTTILQMTPSNVLCYL